MRPQLRVFIPGSARPDRVESGGKVYREIFIPILRKHRFDRCHMPHDRVVDENIDAAERLLGRRHRLLNRSGVPQIPGRVNASHAELRFDLPL
jgi:hypothetical protein